MADQPLPLITIHNGSGGLPRLSSGEADIAGDHRLTLRRWWDMGKPPALWIMLNPSTADASQDDPTIRRCAAFSARHGFGSLTVVNWWTLRTPDPGKLKEWWRSLQDFEQRDDFLSSLSIIIQHAEITTMKLGAIICAWGNPPTEDMATWVWSGVESLREEGYHLRHLGLTKAGNPKHPLARGHHRIADDQSLIWWKA